MALDAQTRSSIYEKLLPLLGPKDSNALMSEFPSIEADELVTKEFLRAELALLRGEMTQLESRVRGDTAQLESGTRSSMIQLESGLRGDMASMEAGIRADMASMETRLTVRIGAAMAANTTIIIGAMALFR